MPASFGALGVGVALLVALVLVETPLAGAIRAGAGAGRPAAELGGAGPPAAELGGAGPPAAELGEARAARPGEVAAFLAERLGEETEEVAANVDGGQLGRPIRRETVESWISNGIETDSSSFGPAECFVVEASAANESAEDGGQEDEEEEEKKVAAAVAPEEIAANCCVRVGRKKDYRPAAQVAYLVLVYTAPELRGRGAASACIRRAEEAAFGSEETEELVFLVADRNAGAQRFYDRLGFEPRAHRKVLGGVPMTLFGKGSPSWPGAWV